MRKLIKKFIPDFIVKKYRNNQEQKKIKSYQRDMVFYQGDKVFCPICKSKFKMFAPFGLVKRKNAKCINCYSLERHRLLFKYLSAKNILLRKKLFMTFFLKNKILNTSLVTYFRNYIILKGRLKFKRLI